MSVCETSSHRVTCCTANLSMCHFFL